MALHPLLVTDNDSSNLVFADNNDRSFPVEVLGGSVT